MHSSRMCTVHNSSRLPGGSASVHAGIPPPDQAPPGADPPSRADPPGTRHPHPPPGQTDRCRNITFATSLRTVIMSINDICHQMLWPFKWEVTSPKMIVKRRVYCTFYLISNRVDSELLSMCFLIFCLLQGMDENKSKKKRGAFGFFRRMGRTVLKTRHTEYNIEPDTNLRGSKKYKKQIDPEQQVRGPKRLQFSLSLYLISSLIVKGGAQPNTVRLSEGGRLYYWTLKSRFRGFWGIRYWNISMLNIE